MKVKTKINQAVIKPISGIIHDLKLNSSFYNRPFLTLEREKELLFRMYFFSVAICHQTHKLYSEKLNLWGWDYLEYGFLEMAKNNSPLLSPEYLINTENSLIENQLARYFSDDYKPETSSLDRLDERVLLMTNAAKIIHNKYNNELSNMFSHSQAYLIKNKQGLYEQLEQFEAFSDPQKKKSTFLIKLLKEAGLIRIIDDENFVPIMDYHMQRVLLRSGCVEITDEDLKNSLINREKLSTDEPVRSSCIEALSLIAELSNREVTKMNDFFWSMGRSCCSETTLCHDKKCVKQPCTFSTIVQLENHKDCFIAEHCMGNSDENYRKLWEPIVKTHYY